MDLKPRVVIDVLFLCLKLTPESERAELLKMVMAGTENLLVMQVEQT